MEKPGIKIDQFRGGGDNIKNLYGSVGISGATKPDSNGNQFTGSISRHGQLTGKHHLDSGSIGINKQINPSTTIHGYVSGDSFGGRGIGGGVTFKF